MATEQPEVSVRDAHAGAYDDWYAARGWWARAELRELLYRFRAAPGDVVADIGCGTGRLVPELAPLASHVYATDFSPASIEVLKRKCEGAPWGDKVTALVSDMSQPSDLPSGAMDKVISLQAYEHVRPEGRQVALSDFRRILKPEGRLWLEVYSQPSWVYDDAVPAEGVIGDAIYFKRWTRDQLREELEAGGFRVVGIYPVLRWPQLRRLGGLGEAIELAAHRWFGHAPVSRCAYWLAEAVPR